MVFKPNYNQQRAERDRAKQAKKEAKLREREDAAAVRRKSEQDGPGLVTPGLDTPGLAINDAEEPRGS